MVKVLVPTTLIIDFYDSYTRNLLSLFSKLGDLTPITTTSNGSEAFTWDLNGWQERVVVINVDSMTWESFVEEILPFIHCVILGPGPGSPHKTEDFSWPTRLIKEFGDVLPILGVCLGHQGLATTFGGKVCKAPVPRHGQLTNLRHESDALFAGIPNGFGAIQFNSLVVQTEGLPDELEAIAWGMNKGIENIMALRHRSRPLWGVQFHPESIASTYGATLLSNILSLVKSHHLNSSSSTLNSLHPLPPRIRSLTTNYTRGAPNPIPDIPSPDPASNQERWKWEQRSLILEGPGTGLEPQDVFERFVKGKNEMGEVWLDSARATVSPQFSHLLLAQLTWSFSQSTSDITIRTSSTSVPLKRHLSPPSTFFTALGTSQGHLRHHTRIIDPTLPSIPIGFVGYLAYEMKETTLPFCVPPPSGEPERIDSEFAFASTALSYEHDTGIWRVTGLVRLATTDIRVDSFSSSGGEEEFGLSPLEWKDYLGTVLKFFSSPIESTTIDFIAPTSISLSSLVPDLNSTNYQSAINEAKSQIISGEAYELCLTTQFRRTLPPSLSQSPYNLYKSLRERNPAPYSSYFNLPLSSISLLSSSPERYMRIEKSGFVEMKPIKGTVRRCLDNSVEDERRRAGLEADEKERAENLMIVDLCRNDLLGFCHIGSVKVPRLMVVESYQTVHQLVSSIVGDLSPVVNPFEAIARAFPPGSMTGAPKLRSVQLLEELEGHRPRGVYSGVFGYVAIDGTTDFSVVIRTLVIKKDLITMGAGGAITHLSIPENEWEEALIKAEAVLGSK